MIIGLVCIVLSLFLLYQGYAVRGMFKLVTLGLSDPLLFSLGWVVLKWAIVLAVMGLVCGVWFIVSSRKDAEAARHGFDFFILIVLFVCSLFSIF